MKRTYQSNGNIPIVNTLIVPKDTLISLGYVYFEFIFYGGIQNSDISINYNYSMGQAEYGNGAVHGLSTNEYFFSTTLYGTSGRTVSLYNNGEKLFEKTLLLDSSFIVK